MTKIVLGHCYTTRNKGDAGIVIGTIQTIKAHRPDAKLIGVSTFASSDPDYINHHQDYVQAGTEMTPALLPEDKLQFGGVTLNSTAAKLISFGRNLIVLALNLLLFRIHPRMAFGDVGRTLRAMDGADLFLSKGGSFLYNEGGFRGDISLFKLLVPFWVAKRLGLRTIILGQSLGPFNSNLAKRLFASFLPSIDRIYLRETKCLRYLDYLPKASYGSKIDNCPDVAFALSSEGFEPLFDVSRADNHVGITIVNHRFKTQTARQAYVAIFSRAVTLLNERLGGATFHVFPQVLSPAVDGTVDMELSEEIAAYCRDIAGIELDLIDADVDARTLRESYRRMRFFIATRLHSSIFASSVGVPTIVFGYHGTKAEGIWHDLGLPNLFFDINAVDTAQVEAALLYLVENEQVVSQQLTERTAEWRRLINQVVKNELERLP